MVAVQMPWAWFEVGRLAAARVETAASAGVAFEALHSEVSRAVALYHSQHPAVLLRARLVIFCRSFLHPYNPSVYP